MVFTIGIQLTPPFVEESQPATFVKVPLSVNVPLLDPVHTEVLELTVAEEAASTVMIAGTE